MSDTFSEGWINHILSPDDDKSKQCLILEHDARVTVRYISPHCPLNEAWVIMRLCCTSPQPSQHGHSPELVIWHLWEAALGVEYLTRPGGHGSIKCTKNAKPQHIQWWNWSAPLDGCRCEPERGDYTSVPPLTPEWNWFKLQLASMHHVRCQECDLVHIVCWRSNVGHFRHLKGDLLASRW